MDHNYQSDFWADILSVRMGTESRHKYTMSHTRDIQLSLPDTKFPLGTESVYSHTVLLQVGIVFGKLGTPYHTRDIWSHMQDIMSKLSDIWCKRPDMLFPSVGTSLLADIVFPWEGIVFGKLGIQSGLSGILCLQAGIVYLLLCTRFPSADNMYRNEDRALLQLGIRFPSVGILFAEPDTSFHKRDIRLKLSGTVLERSGRRFQSGDT